MELRELLSKLDGRKKSVTLYKLYSLTTGFTETVLKEPLELNTAQDVFATSPRAALEYAIRRPGSNYGVLLAADIATAIESADNEIFKSFDVMPDDVKKDAFTVTTKEYPSGTTVTTTSIDKSKIPGYVPTEPKLNTVAIVEIDIPISELEKYPPCYDINHESIPTDYTNLGDDLIALTLQDRAFGMNVKVYELKSFKIKYKKGKTDDTDEVKISDIKLNEITAS